MSVIDVMTKFEFFLRSQPEEYELDIFLSTIRERDQATMAFVRAWGQQGHLRDQLPFMCALYTNGIYVEPHSGAETALVYFGGLFTPMFFALARKSLRHLPAHSIYLYDRKLLNYACGVRELGPTAEGMHATLRRLFKELRATRIVNVGYSGGAFSAMYHALQMQVVDTAVLFSPFSTFAAEHTTFDGRGASVVERVRSVAPECLVDTLPLLAHSASPRKIVSFHCETSPLDAWHAGRLQTLPNTRSFALRGWSSHDIFPPLVGFGAIETFFGALIRSGTEDAVQSLASCRSDRSTKLSLHLAEPLPKTPMRMEL